jgi:hypothetical protein
MLGAAAGQQRTHMMRLVSQSPAGDFVVAEPSLW